MNVKAESKQQAVSVCGFILDNLEKNARIGAAFALLLMFLLALGQSAGKLLWWDELVTVKTATLPRWNDVWTFYASGLDTTGPIQSLIARMGLELPISPEIGSRLPFTLAYLVMCFCIYVFMRRRYPVGYGLAALLYPLHHPFFDYATEARAYALVLAGAGVAMLCWQSAVSGRHRRWAVFGLWFGLAFAISAHAFAIFLFVPFALAQFVEDFKRKKPDWAIWAAIFLFPCGILPVVHGELLAGKIYGHNFWSQPDMRSILPMYKEFFFSYWSYVIFLTFVAIGAFLVRRLGWGSDSESKMRGLSLPEWILAAALALLPLYVVPASYPLHVYTERYVLSFNIGLVVLAIAAVAEAARRQRLAGAVLFALFLAASIHHRVETLAKGVDVLVHPDRVHEQLQAGYNNLACVKILQESQLPVVADDVFPYSQLEYYGRPEIKNRLTAITDIRDVRKYAQTATNQLNFLTFGRQFSYRVADVGDFARTHPHFLLAESARKFVWMPSYVMEHQGAGGISSICLGPDCTGSGPNIFDLKAAAMPEDATKPDSVHRH